MVSAGSPLIVILGQTGSGKSELALEIAERFGGEIICADSRTIYRGMDIGTAKPTPVEQARIPHHVLDVAKPSDTFSAAEFKKLAAEAIDDITKRGRIPVMAGGTGLYIDSVLFDFQFGPAADEALRAVLADRSIEELQTMIADRGYNLPENARNKRYLIRTLERGTAGAEHAGLRPDTLIIGVRRERDDLRDRLSVRVEAMVARGFVDEVKRLIDDYGADCPGANAPGYKAFIPYLRGEISLQEAKDQFVKNDAQLAKRQATWFRRPIYQNSIHWVTNRLQAVDLVTTFLNKY